MNQVHFMHGIERLARPENSAVFLFGGRIMKTKLRNSVLAITAALTLGATGMANAAYFLLPTPDNSTAI